MADAEKKKLQEQTRVYYTPAGKFDPCPPIVEKTFITPPQLFIAYQPAGLEQFSPKEALKKGTLWPDLYSPYEPKRYEEVR
ncbi:MULTISPECIES: spore coat associated protein CotJA [Paenibacillus]|uniref:spore coat associated protein CotJA n=1 Tax=Paenibacillus TaxID=44249 RepID=UPI0022B8D107|nr:spore coat associated protein CotJA [Paenibacillus caseinilyticus]MCZ8518661.1 spore coat associated protein CotJA [Paenibacillus caseinilyticus]